MRSIALAISTAAMTAAAAHAAPQMTGDFTRSDCSQAFKLAQAVSDSDGSLEAAIVVPPGFPSKLSLYSVGHQPVVLGFDPTVFQQLDRGDFAKKGLVHVYWQTAPYGKRLIIAQVIFKGKSDFEYYLIDASITAPVFLDAFNQDYSLKRRFRPISDTPVPMQLFSDKMTGRIWELDRGGNSWAIFSLDEDWTNARCEISFPSNKKLSFPEVTADDTSLNKFCMESMRGQHSLFCGAGLTESERRKKIWSLLAGHKLNPDVRCNGVEHCRAIAAAFQTRNGFKFEQPKVRAMYPNSRELRGLIPKELNPDFGKYLIEDGCDSRCAHTSKAAGPVVIYDVPSYKDSGRAALRFEFYGMLPEGKGKSEPDIRLTQIVDGQTGAVAESGIENVADRIDAGFFRYQGSEYQYEISQPFGGDGYTIVVNRGGPEIVSDQTGFVFELD